MFSYKKFFNIKITIIFVFFSSVSLADNHNMYEILELIQKDLKTLEKAVYSESTNIDNNSQSNLSMSDNSEDVLTRHLLKLSDIENQFQQLTNRFEEINFKLDKLSSRLSKIQADNQIRFQDIESFLNSTDSENKISLKTKSKSKKKRIAWQFRATGFRVNFL